MGTPGKIPIPWRQHWQLARMRLVPAAVFVIALALMASLWHGHVAAPTLVGQAEPLMTSVSCYKPGVLAELSVVRFQQVRSGDIVGQVLVTDPKILASSLAVILADIEMLRAGMEPIAAQQRTALDFNRLRLDWMDQRARLATARVNLQFAEAEFARTEELYRQKLVSQSLFEQTRSTQDRLRAQVAEITTLVGEMEANARSLQMTNTMDLSKVSEDPLRAAIAVQESKLRLTEAESSPIILRAPMGGMVDLVYHRAGEAINAGEPIVAIAATNSVRIVGYLRPPILHEPKVGMAVEVRTRNQHRDSAVGRVLEVGTQIEAIAPALLPPVRLANSELGLPIGISVPAGLSIRPGELVDLTLRPVAD